MYKKQCLNFLLGTNSFCLRKLLFIFIFGLTGLTNVFAQDDFDENDDNLRVEFSEYGGFYEESLILKLYAPQARIHYTLDGEIPTTSSPRYKEALYIDKTIVVRAAAFREDEVSSIVTHTFFINEPKSKFPIISITVKPALLFDKAKGLFEKGFKADTTLAQYGANFWSRQELIINTEMFETDGRCVYNSPSGLRVFGGMSRVFPQKSVAIISRKKYGKKRFKHKIFPNSDLKKFKYLVLRNSGSDWGKSHFRDAFMTGLLDHWDMEKQAYRPSHTYINGKYWGIYNIREKVNTYFLASHYKDINVDSIDLIEHRKTVKKGNGVRYYSMLDFIKENDISEQASFDKLGELMDIDNFMNYQIAQIYFDNTDAGGNIKFWRPQRRNAKWRWILYDTDMGFGLYNKYAYRNNSLEFHTEPNGPHWPNPPWSTLILRKLLQNKDFKLQFINRFADHLNTTFKVETVKTALSEKYNWLKPEMPRHLERWRLSSRSWYKHLAIMKTFAEKRPEYLEKFLNQKFDIGESLSLSFSVEGGGKIVLNDYINIKDQFVGRYFKNIPVIIEAKADLGYQFSHWEGIGQSSDVLRFDMNPSEENQRIKAVFKKADYKLKDLVFINEVSSNRRKSGDWVELYNSSGETVNIKDWILKDDLQQFVLPDFELAPQQYVTICEDTTKFRRAYPNIYPIIGNLKFGFNKVKETIQLFTSLSERVDSIAYEVPPTDSLFTLDLLLPTLNNQDPENWAIQYGKGTPNADNPSYVKANVKAAQERWLIFGSITAIILIFGLMIRTKR